MFNNYFCLHFLFRFADCRPRQPKEEDNSTRKDKVVSLYSLTERTSMTGKVIETNFNRYAQEGHLLRSATASEISEIEFEGREDGISCSLCDVIGTQVT
ncbi:hypothetical protein L2E82_21069 [Cichorium intybus]|uniref:Uncharacterized protein n=1 Tax=Cichorium intybus TaxID=13427 RepID=A0ACB9DVE0_CICIN|nr:hypothetical protein L2E82_21069 [Cichorium intybus]